MAVVVALEKDDRDFRGAHPTHVTARYLLAESGGRKVLQINTYGSEERANPGKLSQTLQFSEAGARELFELLRREYGF